MDKNLGDELKKVLTNHLGFEFHLSNKVQSVKTKGKKVEIISENKNGEQSNNIQIIA